MYFLCHNQYHRVFPLILVAIKIVPTRKLVSAQTHHFNNTDDQLNEFFDTKYRLLGGYLLAHIFSLAENNRH